MKLNILKKLKVNGFKVFASLPDMGKVGGLVSTYLAQNLQTDCVAKIISNEKPWVFYSDGIVKVAEDVYNIYYDKSNKVLIFSGNSQPQESIELHKLCNTFLDYVKTVGKTNLLYAAGGYLQQQVTFHLKLRHQFSEVLNLYKLLQLYL